MNTHTGKKIGLTLIGLLMGALLLGGCGKKDDGPKHRSREGTVTRIDPATGEVGMRFYNPKEKREQEIVGTLAPEAEILINGRTATLEEVKIDDMVSVTGRVEKDNGEPKFVAVKVHITRPTGTEPADVNSPETQPGA